MNFIAAEPEGRPRKGMHFGASIKLKAIMRVSIMYVVVSVVTIGFCAAHASFGQPPEQRITKIKLENEPLLTFFSALKEETGLSFVIPGKVKEYDDISLPGAERTVKEALDLVLEGTGLSYRFMGNTVFIYEAETIEVEAEKGEGNADEISFTITGKVTDVSTRLPLPGVNILVKGTTEGTTTNADGNFSIDVDDGETLIFSFIGFKTMEVKVTGGVTTMDVMMEVEAAALKEVIINAGYYDVKDREKTGNISKVTAKEIQRQPVQNPIAALQGRVPGLEIAQTSGSPSGNFRIRIRGTNSIANGNDPLFVIDGVPYTSAPLTSPQQYSGQISQASEGILGSYSLNGSSGGTSPLNSLNPADIESIEVLKDADATAIYGSRGSNGVILITTKKGQAGKTKVEFNFYRGAGTVMNKLNLLNTREYLSMRREALRNDNVTPTIANARDLLVWDTTRYTDWQEELIGGTANTTDAQISLSGGDNLTRFSFGAGYHKETTVFPGDNSDRRISFHMSLTNSSSNKRLKTSISINYSANNTDLPNLDLTSKALFLPPNAPAIYRAKGELNWDGWNTSGPYENPLAFLSRRYEAKSNALMVSGEIDYSILPNLELKSRIGFNNMGLNSFNLNPKSSHAPAVAATSLNATIFSNSTFQNLMVEPQASWKPKLGNAQLNVLIGTQFLEETTEGILQSASGFTSEALMKNIAAAPNRFVGTNSYAQYRYHALFGRVNYNYNGRYVINLTARRDGSSRFGPGKQFASFGAVGVAWIFSNEARVKNALPFLSFGKLRSSYGITGNDQLTDYQYLDAYTSSSTSYQGVIGLTPSRIYNPDFAWETNKKIEAAVELGFVDDRILTSVSLYQNRSSNQLVGHSLPPTAGFNIVQANFPATVQNAGVEIELTTVNVRHKELTWTTSLNVSLPRNKLVEFPNLINFPSYANTYVVGQPLTIAKVYHYTGVNPLTGVYEFEDANGDGNLDDADKQTIKFNGTKFHGGIQNSITYKGVQVDVLFQFSKSAGRNYLYTGSSSPGGAMANQPDYVLDRWQSEGDHTNVQRFGRSTETSKAFNLFVVSDNPRPDFFFVRVKNLSLSYVLPSHWIVNSGISSARLFIQGQNLLTMSDYKGMDPETVTGFLPPLRIISGGVSVTF